LEFFFGVDLAGEAWKGGEDIEEGPGEEHGEGADGEGFIVLGGMGTGVVDWFFHAGEGVEVELVHPGSGELAGADVGLGEHHGGPDEDGDEGDEDHDEVAGGEEEFPAFVFEEEEEGDEDAVEFDGSAGAFGERADAHEDAGEEPCPDGDAAAVGIVGGPEDGDAGEGFEGEECVDFAEGSFVEHDGHAEEDEGGGDADFAGKVFAGETCEEPCAEEGACDGGDSDREFVYASLHFSQGGGEPEEEGGFIEVGLAVEARGDPVASAEHFCGGFGAAALFEAEIAGA